MRLDGSSQNRGTQPSPTRGRSVSRRADGYNGDRNRVQLGRVCGNVLEDAHGTVSFQSGRTSVQMKDQASWAGSLTPSGSVHRADEIWVEQD
jgi:hypothetical protein